MNEVSFEQMELTPKIKQAVDEMGFVSATGIQSEVIPLIRQGIDVIGQSQTGTGKTLAFAIPAIELIDNHSAKPILQVLVLCPTRELAQQACSEIGKLTKFKSGINAVEVYGGAPMERQIYRLRTANIVIGTPGRIMDHMRRGTIKLANLKMVVLDEADEMLSMGFREDIETILADTPDDRQTILFSATMPPGILQLTKLYQKSPRLVAINKTQVTAIKIEQCYVDCPAGKKQAVLNLLLHYYQPRRTLIFCNTKRMVDEITAFLLENGFEAEALHGDLPQAQRTKVMNSFKQGKTAILVATDVAARGIDVNNINYVFNYDIPQQAEYYVHRIGRTGRAGKDGKAITLVCGRHQMGQFSDIVRLSRSTVKNVPIPNLTQIRTANMEHRAASLDNMISEAGSGLYGEIIDTLIKQGHSAEKIAEAALELAFGSSEPQWEEVKGGTRPAESRHQQQYVKGKKQEKTYKGQTKSTNHSKYATNKKRPLPEKSRKNIL